MVDLVDMAEEFQAMNLQEKLNARAQFSAVSASECADCGDDIPTQRQALGGVTRCIECQTEFEATQKHYRG